MKGTRGRFVEGRWVEEPEPAQEQQQPTPAEAARTEEQKNVEELVSRASGSVEKAISDVLKLGNTLLGTKEGHEHIEKTARSAGERLQKAITEIAETAKKKIR
jgi:predicted transcriptional regulator